MPLQVQGSIAEGSDLGNPTTTVPDLSQPSTLAPIAQGLQNAASGVAQYVRTLDKSQDTVDAYNLYSKEAFTLRQRIESLKQNETDPSVFEQRAGEIIEEFSIGRDEERLQALSPAGLLTFKQLFTGTLVKEAEGLFATGIERKEASIRDGTFSAINQQVDDVVNTTGALFFEGLESLNESINLMDPALFPEKEQFRQKVIKSVLDGVLRTRTITNPVHMLNVLNGTVKGGLSIPYWIDGRTQDVRHVDPEVRSTLLALAHTEIASRGAQRKDLAAKAAKDRDASAALAKDDYYLKVMNGDYNFDESLTRDPRLRGYSTFRGQILAFRTTERQRRYEGDFNNTERFNERLIAILSDEVTDASKTYKATDDINGDHRSKLVETFFAHKGRKNEAASSTYYRSRREGAQWLKQRLQIFEASSPMK